MSKMEIQILEKASDSRFLTVLLVGSLGGVCLAQESGTQALAKGLLPYEGLLTKGCIALLLLFVALIVWEVLEQKRSSRSSLDIAKLAAAAAKKKASTAAPASGSLPGSEAPGQGGRSFAPPPPPPPPQTSTASQSQSAPPPPPPPADNPFAAAGSSPSHGGQDSLGGIEQVDSTVAFNPPDAGSSGGWADLLQRVRAGEPEAASFGAEDAPPPLTESESSGSFEVPSFGHSAEPAPEPSSPFAPATGEPSASSEAWEALLKRTTGTGDGPPPPSQDSDKILLGGSPAPMPVVTSTPFSIGPDAGTPPANPGFSLPPANNPPTGDHGGSGFSLPGSGSSAPASSGFSLPSAASASDASAPSFKLPTGSEPSQGSGFQLPGQGSSSPFGGGMDDPSSTLPLSDMFSGSGVNSAPPFQLPSVGHQQSGSNPFDFSGGGPGGDGGAGRTISLDFSQGAGQLPPPPQPKTEG